MTSRFGHLFPTDRVKWIFGIAQTCALYGLFIGVVLLLQSLSRWGVTLGKFSYLIQLVVAWPLALGVGLRWSRLSFREAFPLTRFPVHTVLALFTVSFGTAILIMCAGFLISKSKTIENCLMQHSALSSRLNVFFPVVLVAPLAEELFFRGLVLRSHLAGYSLTAAVWISAVLFALAHLNLWQAAAALPLGLGYAWLSLRTGSLLPGILSHMTVNFTYNFLMTPLALALGYDEPALRALNHMPPSILKVGIATAGLGGYLLWRQLAKLQKARNDRQKPSLPSSQNK